MEDYRNTRLSPLNPVRFVPVDTLRGYMLTTTPIEPYHSWPFDQGFFTQQRRVFQTPKHYTIKLNQYDIMPIYVDSLCNTIDYFFLDEYGNNLGFDFTDMPPIGTVTGNTFSPDADPDVTVVYNTFYSVFWPYDIGLPYGIFYVLMRCNYDSGYVDYISEPIHYREAAWNKTILFQYGGTKNDPKNGVMYGLVTAGDYFVNGTDQKLTFCTRIEAFLDDPEPGSDDTIFISSKYNPLLLKSTQYRKRELMIGGYGGIPAYRMQLMNLILGSEQAMADNQPIVKDDKNPQISVTKNADNQMQGGKIYVREVDEIKGWSFSSPRGVHLVDLPHDGSGNIVYPFAWNYLAIHNPNNTIITPTAVFDNRTQLDDYIVAANAQARAEGARGFFCIVGGSVYYNPAYGEVYNYFGDMRTCYRYVQYTMCSEGTYKGILIGIETITGGSAALTIWEPGDGTAPRAQQTSNYNINHTYYGSTANRKLRIFHAGDDGDGNVAIGRIATGYNDRCWIKCIDSVSVFPSYLKDLSHRYGFGGFGSSYPIHTTGLQYAKDTLTTIQFAAILSSGNIYPQNVFNVFGLDGRTFSDQLLYVIISVPDGNSAAANAVMNAFNLNVNRGSGGLFGIGSNAGTSPLTGFAATVAATLVSTFGWTVYSD